MSLIQAIARAQALTEQTCRQYIVLAELKQRHKPSYRVTDGFDWYRYAAGAPEHAARYRQVYPAVAP
jgi:hypothetical protein